MDGTPEILPQHILALMHAPPSAVIVVTGDGWVRVAAAAGPGEVVVYSQARLLAEGVVFTPDGLEELAGRLTDAVERRERLVLVA
ncbi:hypothetical protein GCM10027294_25930 [Marinactinospora endophytica]